MDYSLYWHAIVSVPLRFQGCFCRETRQGLTPPTTVYNEFHREKFVNELPVRNSIQIFYCPLRWPLKSEFLTYVE